MHKVKTRNVEPVEKGKVRNYKFSMKRPIRSVQKKLELIFLKREWILFIFGFLLGRAFILSTLTPFSLPFFATIFYVKKNRALRVFSGLMLGALSYSFGHSIYTFGIIALFIILNRFIKLLFTTRIRSVPFTIFITMFIVRLILFYLETSEITAYSLVMAGVEASLAFVLTLIFLQSVPVLSFSERKQGLKTEEIVCLIILLGSVITGTIGWNVEGVTIANILSRYLVLIFAYVAGATVGATVGVVTGLIFGLADINSFPEMSLLAFSGLLGGLLKEGKKYGVTFGLVVATLLIGMYSDGSGSLVITLFETGIAGLIFFCTPQGLIHRLAKYIPGTAEHTAEQGEYVRRVRDVTANRVTQFSSMFDTLGKSFDLPDIDYEQEELRDIDNFVDNITRTACKVCYRKDKCWVTNFDRTYANITEIMTQLTEKDRVALHTQELLQRFCVKSDKLIEQIRGDLHLFNANKKLKEQIRESRKIVAEQLYGVSKVMKDFAMEIQKERENHEKQEEQIYEALQTLGVDIGHIEIYSIDQGNVDIDISIPYCAGMGQCEKLIAPLLSDILKETITVHSEQCARYPHEYCHATFRSVKKFVVEPGVAYAAKGGKFVTGDSYKFMEIGASKYALAISDGMGNGPRAHSESNETLQLLKEILQSGIDEEIAIKSVNSLLALRTTDEIYSTLDLAIIDLQDAKTKFLKVGSMPSFIKRASNIMSVQAGNLPIGIIEEVEIDVVNEQLKAEDLIIMVSDGVFQAPQYVENVDLWLKRKIRGIQTTDPQEVADILLEEVIRARGGEIEDDMMIVVAKVKHNTPKWKSIPAYSLKKMA